MIEWLGTRVRLNSEVTVMIGIAARYRRATFGRSIGDTHSGTSVQHKRAICLHPDYLKSLFFIMIRAGNRARVYEMLPAFSVGPLRQREAPCVLSLKCAAFYIVCGVGCADHHIHPVKIGDERGRLVTASPVMANSRGPSWGI
jgi:hypothetical protein